MSTVGYIYLHEFEVHVYCLLEFPPILPIWGIDELLLVLNDSVQPQTVLEGLYYTQFLSIYVMYNIIIIIIYLYFIIKFNTEKLTFII